MRANTPKQPGLRQPSCTPELLTLEQRMAGRALMAWRRSQRGEVSGFEANSMVVIDPGGEALIERLAPEIAAAFGLKPGQRLCDAQRGSIALDNELRDACDLVAMGGRPIPLEISISRASRPIVIVRGIALPLAAIQNTPAGLERVQIIISWRNLLSRSANGRLQRELGAVLRSLPSPKRASKDPFFSRFT